MLFGKQILIQREYGVEQYEKFRQRTDWIGGGEMAARGTKTRSSARLTGRCRFD